MPMFKEMNIAVKPLQQADVGESGLALLQRAPHFLSEDGVTLLGRAHRLHDNSHLFPPRVLVKGIGFRYTCMTPVICF